MAGGLFGIRSREGKGKAGGAMKCQRCGRGHSGLCGIPPRITLGFKIGIGGLGGGMRQASSSLRTEIKHGRPKATKLSTSVLEGLLEEGHKHYKEVTEMLKQLPPSMPEYDQLLDKESKLKSTINQILGQIQSRI